MCWTEQETSEGMLKLEEGGHDGGLSLRGFEGC